MIDLAQVAPSPEDILIAQQDAEQIDRALDRFLLPREALAVRWRYGLRCEPHLYKEIAQRYGVQPTRVQQIVAKAERRLVRRLQHVFPERHAVMEERRKKLFGNNEWPVNWRDQVRDREYRLATGARFATRTEQHNAHVFDRDLARRDLAYQALQQRAEAFYQQPWLRRSLGLPTIKVSNG